MKQEYYKKEEIEDTFYDFIEEQTKEWIEENIDDIHHHAFNTDYYIIGTYQAKQWCGDQVFNIIETIREYEDMHFGEVNTDFSDAEKVVNMYAYIVGEQVVSEWLDYRVECAGGKRNASIKTERLWKTLKNMAEEHGRTKWTD